MFKKIFIPLGLLISLVLNSAQMPDTNTLINESKKAAEGSGIPAGATIEGLSRDYGTATITTIRNSTSSGCDFLFRSELDSLQSEIPNGTVIKIKTIDPYFAPDPNDPKADPYLYYKVERMSGTYRLVASTKNPTDPATEFIVEHLRDEKLIDWLLLRPVAQDKSYVLARKGQEVCVKEIDTNGPVNFSSDKSPHWAHWRLVGSSFANCQLKSRNPENGFLSCRDLKDLKKIDPFGYQPVVLKPGNKLEYNPIRVYGWETYDQQGGIAGFRRYWRRIRQSVKDIKTDFSNKSLATNPDKDFLLKLAYNGLTTFLQDFAVKAWMTTAAGRDDTAIADERMDLEFSRAEDFKLEHAILLSRVAAIMKNNSFDSGVCQSWLDPEIITVSQAACDGILKTFSPEPGTYSKALLDAATRESAFEKNIAYGDVVRIANIKTCLHLFASKNDSEVLLGSEYNQEMAQNFIKNTDLNNSQFVFPGAYFIIKGPHFGDDDMNAEVGQPVKNGDRIRLESVLPKKNLSCKKIAGQAGQDDQVVPLLAGKDGIGTNNDNFIITFVQADGSKAKDNFSYGQVFKLMHQNTGTFLTFDNVRPANYDSASTPLNIGCSSTNSDSMFWVCDFCQKSQLPVKRVAWTGVPYGAAATDATSKEALLVEIVRKGAGGGIASNTTLNFGLIRLDTQEPLVTGFTKETAEGFSPGMQITLNPLISKGIGWVSTSFERENQAGITFLVRAMDSGNAEIILGQDMSLDFVYKLVLGDKNNSCTTLYRRTFDASGRPVDTPVAEVEKSAIAYATLRSGLFGPYWVSVNNGIIMAGMGQQIGENIILAYKEPLENKVVSRVGFGCNKDKIDITEVKLGLPLEIGFPNVEFAKNANSVQLPAKLTKLLASSNDLSLRVPGRASIAFDLERDKNIQINLLKKDLSSSKSNYKIMLNTALGSQKDAIVQRNWAAAKDFVVKAEGYLKEAIAQSSKTPTSPSVVNSSSLIDSIVIKAFCAKLIGQLSNILPSDVFVDKNLSVGITKAVEGFIDKFSQAVESIAGMNFGDFQTILSKISDQKITNFVQLIGQDGLNLTLAQDLGLGNYGNTQSLTAGFASLLCQIFNNSYFNLFKRSCLVIEKSTGPKSFKTIKVIDDSCIDGFEKNIDEKTVRFWFNFVDGKFFVGTGEFGKNVFCYAQDFQVGSAKDALDNFNEIEIIPGQTSPAQSISNIVLGSELEIANLKEEATYDLNQKIFNYKGAFQIISPYRYKLSQYKEQVFFKDEISGVTHIPGSVPQKGAIYEFMLILSDENPPKLEWRREPSNPEMVSKARSAYIRRAVGDSLFQASTYVQGTGALGGIIGVAMSGAFAGAGIAAQKAAIEKEADLKEYRDHNSQVFTDQAKQRQLMLSSVPVEAQANRDSFEKELAVGGNWIGDPTKLGLLIPHFLKCLSRVTHPYVVENQSNKDLLISYIGSLYKTHQITYAEVQKPDNTFYDMVKLLMQAYNNRYLTDPTKIEDLKIRKDWYLKANDIFAQILKMLSKTDSKTSRVYNNPIELPAMSGEYVWLDKNLPTPGQCSISFNAKGLNDVMVCLANERKSLRTSSDQIYEICFGAKNNTCGEIRTASLSKPALITKNPLALCQQVDVQTPYWINIKNGFVQIGRGPLVQVYRNLSALDAILDQTLDQLANQDQAGTLNVTVVQDTPAGLTLSEAPAKSASRLIASWQDPFPIAEFSCVGISSWDSPVTYSSFCIDDCKEDVNFADQINQGLKTAIVQMVSKAIAMSEQSPGIMQNKLKDVPNFPKSVFDKFATRVEFIDGTGQVNGSASNRAKVQQAKVFSARVVQAPVKQPEAPIESSKASKIVEPFVEQSLDEQTQAPMSNYEQESVGKASVVVENQASAIVKNEVTPTVQQKIVLPQPMPSKSYALTF